MGFTSFFRRRTIFMLAGLLLCFSVDAQLGDCPTFSGRGGFAMVGNVNHNMNFNPSLEENAQNLFVVDEDGNSSTYNSSSAQVCIPQEVCPEDGIFAAYLSWSGKVKSSDSISKCGTVKLSVDQGATYNDITAVPFITGEVDGNTDPQGFYVCHAEVTNYLRSVDLTNGLIYVGNIVSEYLYSADSPSRFSGWTLTVIYRNNKAPKVTIQYSPKHTFTYGSANGKVGLELLDSVDLGTTYTGIGDVRLGMTIAGGYKKENGERFYFGAKDSADLINQYYRVKGKYDTSEETNFLSNYIQPCKGACEDDAISGYTRGYDLHVVNLYKENPSGKYFESGDNYANLLLTHNSEHHLLTDIVVETGLPQPHEVEAVQKVSGDSCLNYIIDINTGDNVEDLANFNITTQLPDYTNKISDFKIYGKLFDDYYKNAKTDQVYYTQAIGLNKKTDGNKKYGSSDRSSGFYLCRELATESWKYGAKDSTAIEKSIQSALNSHIKGQDSTNMTLSLSFSGTIPKELKHQTVLTIEYTVCLNPDAYAEKSAITGTDSEITSQSQLSMSGSISRDSTVVYSNDSPILDKLLDCEMFFDMAGGGGGIGGGGGSGGGGGGSGIDERNGQPTTIRTHFDFRCNQIPDSVHIDGCEGDTLPITIIEQLLLKEHNVDMEKLRKKDTIRWMEIKRDSLIKLCQLAIDPLTIKKDFPKDNSAGLICSDSSNWFIMKDFWEKSEPLDSYDWDVLFDTLTYKFRLDTTFLEMILHPKIDAIIQRPFDVTHLDYRLEINSDWKYVVDGVLDTGIVIKEGNYAVSFVTPYNGGSSVGTSTSNCKDEFIVHVNPEKVDLPHLYKGARKINSGDTIQYCLDAKLETLNLIKKKKNYSLELKDSLSKVALFEYELLSDTIYHYMPVMNTSTKGIDSFKVVQKNNGGCVSDTFTYYIEVLDVKSTIKPKLSKDTIVCIEDKDSIELVIINPLVVDSMRNEGFDVAWYLIDDTNTHNDSLLIKDVTSIKVPKDSVGKFGYGATFYYLGCESEMDTIVIEVKPLPAKLSVPNISFCQYVEADSLFIANSTMKANNGRTDFSSLLWYPYNATATAFDFTAENSTSLTSILDVDIDFTKKGEKNIIVAPMSKFGCIGDTSLLTINVIPFDSTKTQFKNKIDSVLFCIGDATKDITTFIDTSLYPKNSQWAWFFDESDVPTNSTEIVPVTGITPSYNTLATYSHDFYLVRVDSSSCISNPSRFRVVVGDSIQSTPFVGDTTQVDYTNNAALIELCRGEHRYEKDILPLKATVDGYTMEAIKKENFTDDCDTLLKKDPKRLEWNSKKWDSILVPDSASTSYYCIRQSTPMGCHGPWTTITMIVHDSVTSVPSVDTIRLCQYDKEVMVSDYVTNTTTLNLRYYDAEKKVIDISKAIVTAEKPSTNFTTLKNNLFYVALVNSDTKCEGRYVGVESMVRTKPQMPVVLNDSLYFCVDNQVVDLTASTGATVHPLDVNTELVWKDASSFVSDRNLRSTYYVYQRDTVTDCVGDMDTIEVFVEKTFTYQPIDTIQVCYGESVDLWTKVDNAISRSSSVIVDADPTFTIEYLLGTTPQHKLSEVEAKSVTSVEQATVRSVQRYLLSISEKISGCSQIDTVVVVFNALPKIDKIDPITKCQYEEFGLPTPETDYNFSWKREDNTPIVVTDKFTLVSSETLTLVASTKQIPSCVDSVKVRINVNEIPAEPLVNDTALCQFSGDHTLKYELVPTALNPLTDISLSWQKADSTLFTLFNTDTVFEVKNLQEKVTAVVTNTYTNCHNSKDITVSILQKLSLGIDDPTPLCQPDMFDATTYINQYISKNKASIGGNEPSLKGYFTLYPSRKELTASDMSSLSFQPSSKQVEYGYVMSDSKGVCIAEDLFTVTINAKPAAPLIEQGADSLFFCQSNAPLSVNATDTTFSKHQELVWQDNAKGLVYSLDETIPVSKLSAYFQDTLTSCESDLSYVTAIVAKPIATKPIGGKDTLIYCGGDTIDLWSMAFKSFTADLKDRSSLSIVSAKKGTTNVLQSTLEELTSTVQDTSTYLFEVMDTLTLCSATNTVTVIFHQLPHFTISGEKEVCYDDSITLKVEGDDRPISYSWYLESTSLSTDVSYKQNNLREDTKFTIVGSLKDLATCKSMVEHLVVVDTLPTPLRDTTINFCQDTLADLMVVNFNRNSSEISRYSIKWYDKDGADLQSTENMNHSITEDGVTVYRVELTDRNTGCISKRANMTVNVHPQIRIRWNNPDTICQPATYNLMEDLAKAVYGGTNPQYQCAVMGTDTIHNETSISENSKLNVYYKDDNGCELMQSVSVQFYAQPGVPTLVGETIICQGTGDVELTAKRSGSNTLNQSFEWSVDKKSIVSDRYTISTVQYGKKSYTLRSVDTLTHCYSEPTEFEMDIREAISYKTVDTLKSCHNVPINLAEIVEANYGGSNEEKHFSYIYIAKSGSETPISDPTSILKTGKYLVKAYEDESRCERKDTVNVLVYDSLSIYVDGDRVLCENGEITLSAKNADTYKWRYPNGSTVEGDELIYTKEEEGTEILRLIGEKRLSSMYCQDSIDVPILIHPNPLALPDSIVDVCQDTLGTPVTLNFNRSASDIAAYSMKWYDMENNLLGESESITQSIQKEGTFIYQAEQINKTTKCVGKRFKMTVNVHPQIRIRWNNPDTICQPAAYNLMEDLAKVVYGGTNPQYQCAVMGTDTIHNETSISENSKLNVYYKDDNGCELMQPVSVQFYAQPGVPTLVGETIICQGTGDVELTAKRSGSNTLNQSFEWSVDKKSIVSDRYTISTVQYGKKSYTLRSVDTLTHCYSEPTEFEMDIREAISYKPVDTLKSCHNVPINLAEIVEANYGGSDEAKHFSYFKVLSNKLQAVADPNSIDQTSKYLVKVSESESGCERADTVNVLMYDQFGLTTEGPDTVCYGSELVGLKALMADAYSWIREDGTLMEGADFPFGSDLTQSEKFKLIGEKKIGLLNCKDSVVVPVTVYPNPITLNDTIFRYCQSDKDAKETIVIPVQANNTEQLRIQWFDASKQPISEQSLTVSTETDGTTVYYVKQVNEITGCESDFTKVTVVVYPMIKVQLQDSVTCHPFTIDLVNLSKGKAEAGSMTSRIEQDRYTYMGEDVSEQATMLDKSGLYIVYYKYEVEDLICNASAHINLTFHEQPVVPEIENQKFCQNTGMKVPVGTPTDTNLRLVWEDVSTYPSTIDTVSTMFSTAIAGEKRYLVRQVHNASRCVSQDTLVKMFIYPSINALDQDTAICYGESVDLSYMAERLYKGGTSKFNYKISSVTGQTFDVAAVHLEGDFKVIYTDSANVCSDTSLIRVNVAKPIQMTIEGSRKLCAGDTLNLKVSGADKYEWQDGSQKDTYQQPTTVASELNLTIKGRVDFKNIYCYADTSVSVVVNPAVQPTSFKLDTCAKIPVYLSNIISMNNIKDEPISLFNKSKGIRYADLLQNLATTGRYEFGVANEYGCQAIHTLDVTIYEPENLTVSYSKSPYCPGAVTDFKASTDNLSDFKWYDSSDLETLIGTGELYAKVVDDHWDYTVIATEKQKGCKDTIDFSVKVYDPIPILLGGTPNLCKGDSLVLSITNHIVSPKWALEDTIFFGTNIGFVPKEDLNITISGRDANGCLESRTVAVQVIDVPTPYIEVVNEGRTREGKGLEYLLDRDYPEVHLSERNIAESDDLTFLWNFGDDELDSISGKDVTHEYSLPMIMKNADVPVTLKVTHSFGCSAMAQVVLPIDPNLEVPNTFLADGEMMFMEEYYMQIFDRVGTLIYEGTGWDGTYKGKPASEDTYFYALVYYSRGEKQVKTGYVTLVR